MSGKAVHSKLNKAVVYQIFEFTKFGFVVTVTKIDRAADDIDCPLQGAFFASSCQV